MFKDNLKEQIEYKGYIIKELAAKAGISKRTLDTYVDSRAVIPNAEIAVKLAKALDTTVEYLVTGENLNISNKSLDLDFSSFEKHKNLFKDLEKLSPNLQYSIEVMIHTLVKLENK